MASIAYPVEPEQQPQELDPMNPEAAVPQMATSLQLTEEQEANLVGRVLARIDELRYDMGLITGITGGAPGARARFMGSQFIGRKDEYYLATAGEVTTTGWMWERECNQYQYDNDWHWRQALGGIFTFSNFSLNLSKRYARLMAAKTSDDLVGTDPFFSCMPKEHGDPELAKQAEWYVQEQITLSNAKKRIKAAQKTALIRNESVIKLSWVTNDTHFRGPGIVAIGPFRYRDQAGRDHLFGPGEPVMTPNGDYVFQKDGVIEDQNVEGLLRLEKEPGMEFRHAFEFAYKDELDQTLHGYTGLDIRELDYRDFLCPLNAATIHEADINVHLFDEQWERLKAQYTGFPVSAKYVNAAYMSGEKQPNLVKREEPSTSKVLHIVNCADVYIRCNPYEGGPNDLGIESEIWMLVDLRAKTPIWYDFLANHMKKRPFEVIPGVELVANRWYGVGVFEMLQHKQLYVDTQFNRVNWKSMKSSSVRFRNKNAVSQWKAGDKIVFGDNTIYDIEDPRFDSKNPPFFEVSPREIDEYAMKLIELMIQAGSTEVGIVGPDDGQVAGLDSTKLATGIKSLERTGNLLMKFTETDHAEGITAVLEQAVDIILEHMDSETLIFKEDTGALLNLNREEIRSIPKDVTLLLTRSRSTETIETARMVIQLVREYYEALTPYERYKLRPEYLRQLKALETPDAASLLDEVTKEQAQQWLDEQARKPEPMPPKTSIATKYPDLERSEQEQVLQREGITPASPAETAKSDAEEVKKTGALAAAEAKAKAEHPVPTKKPPAKK
jgi:hypothetical protein